MATNENDRPKSLYVYGSSKTRNHREWSTIRSKRTFFQGIDSDHFEWQRSLRREIHQEEPKARSCND